MKHLKLKLEMFLENQIMELYLQSLTLIHMCQSMQRLAPKDNSIQFQFLTVEIYAMFHGTSSYQLHLIQSGLNPYRISTFTCPNYSYLLMIWTEVPIQTRAGCATGKPEFFFHFTFTSMLGESHGQVAMVRVRGQGLISAICFLQLCLCLPICQSLYCLEMYSDLFKNPEVICTASHQVFGFISILPDYTTATAF